jgi:hypothetical protein
MGVAGRLKLKGMTAFSAESSWCTNAIAARVRSFYLRKPLILMDKYFRLNSRILHPEEPR